MLADPKHCAIIFVNLAHVVATLGPAATRRKANLALLDAALHAVHVPSYVVGETTTAHLAVPVTFLPTVPLELWRNDQLAQDLSDPKDAVVYLAGAWLEEEILLAAINGVELGYDVRLLLDLCVVRQKSERPAALCRLGQHGVLVTSVRQTLMEWSLAVEDPELRDRLLKLL